MIYQEKTNMVQKKSKMLSPQLIKELLIAKRAVRIASKIAIKVQKNLNSCSSISKEDKSPVTIADYAVQATIALILKNEYKGFPFALVGEENTDLLKSAEYKSKLNEVTELVKEFCPIEVQDSVEHKNKCTCDDVLKIISECNDKGGNDHLFWCLDPIDGTCGFLRNGQYAIGLCLIENGIPILGVIGCPNMNMCGLKIDNENIKYNNGGSLYYGIKDNGSYYENLNDENIKAIKLNSEILINNRDYVTSVESSHSNEELVKKIALESNYKNEAIKFDSMVKYCLVCHGDASLYLRIVKDKNYVEHIWDHASGYVIVKESGNKICDINGKELDFGCGRDLVNNRGIICCHKDVYEEVVENAKRLYNL